MEVTPILVDATNIDQLSDSIIELVAGTKLVGFDIETEDDERHEGLDRYMKVSEETRVKSSSTRLVFDHRRTNVTGFSLYPDGAKASFYINLAHADVENRVPWEKAKRLLTALAPDAYFICHNAPFEIGMMRSALQVELPRVICTLQLAVTAYGPDEYDKAKLQRVGLGGIKKKLGEIRSAFLTFDEAKGRFSMNSEQGTVFAAVTAKESKAEHSYNGLVNSIAYGYGLKQAVKSWFNYDMVIYEQVLGNHAHMGQLTGAEVVAYGADDAYWAVRLYHRLIQFLLDTNPKAIETFFNQENPMIHVYADVWTGGLKVNMGAIEARRQQERTDCATTLRKMKAAVRELLPFNNEPCARLVELEDWYAKNNHRYRTNIINWANSPDSEDDFTQVYQVRGPVSNSWAAEGGKPESIGPNFSHYMPVRVLLYDLIGHKLVISKGKVQSDADCRGRIKDELEKELKSWEENLKAVTAVLCPNEMSENPKDSEYQIERHKAAITVMNCLAELAGIEQRMKLYLTPYSMLVDPETSCMYPVLSSKLATRRMATSFPNPMQLAKRGTSTYIRGFYQADDDESVILSTDWSGIELVEIGEFSQDPEFIKAYGQLPHADLHGGAAADILSVVVPDLTEEAFMSLKKATEEDLKVLHPRLVTNLKGEFLQSGPKAFKYWRTEIGKGANFNYWYSGALGTVAERMGWSSDLMWEAVDRYRKRFAVAEAWRVATIEKAERDGYIELPDGHRRVRLEVTNQWSEIMYNSWRFYAENNDPIRKFMNCFIQAIRSRAKNQIINALIQGTCATMAKRSIIKINETIKKEGFRARFMIPIHDELLYNVHKDEVVDFIPVKKKIMCDHPEIFKTMAVDATSAIGLTFEPFDPKKVPMGQIELCEAPEVPWLPKEAHGKALNDNQIRDVIGYLFDFRNTMRKAA